MTDKEQGSIKPHGLSMNGQFHGSESRLILAELLSRSTVGSSLRVGVSANDGKHTNELLSGVSLALDDAREAKRLEQPIEFLWKNDGRDPAIASAVAEQFCESDVKFVIGHLSASASIAASRVYRRNGVCFLAPATSHPDLTPVDDLTTFRLCASDDAQGTFIAEFCEERLDCDRLVIVCQDIAYGRALRSYVVAASSLPTKTIFLSAADSDALSQEDVTIMSSLAAEDSNFGIVLCGVHELTGRLVAEIRCLGVIAPIIVGDDAKISDFIDLCGGHSANVYVVGFESLQADRCSGIAVSEIEQRCATMTGAPPGAYFWTSFWSAWLLFSAISRVGPGCAASVARELRSRNWATTLGQINFCRRGNALGLRWTMFHIEGGKFVTVQGARNSSGPGRVG